LAVKVWGGAAGRSVQGLFLAFYRIEFLHCLVPMEEAGICVTRACIADNSGLVCWWDWQQL